MSCPVSTTEDVEQGGGVVEAVGVEAAMVATGGCGKGCRARGEAAVL